MNEAQSQEPSIQHAAPAPEMDYRIPLLQHDGATHDGLQIAEQIHHELSTLEPELPNIALDEAELATLNELIERYDRVIHDLDLLNGQIENLLAEESIKGCDS